MLPFLTPSTHEPVLLCGTSFFATNASVLLCGPSRRPLLLLRHPSYLLCRPTRDSNQTPTNYETPSGGNMNSIAEQLSCQNEIDRITLLSMGDGELVFITKT